jgi:dTDP-4-amino-4,6-dideoxygalactose transaminase
MQPYYKNLGFKIGHFPNAETYYQQAITLPLFPELTFEQVELVVDKLAAEIGS